MIPRDFITEWRAEAPWVADRQIEQDLVISRALVELFSRDVVAKGLAFRGGTALYKLHLRPAARYSEDIDLVQTSPQPIGTALDAIHEAPLDREPVEVRERVRVSSVSFDTVSSRRRLRRYVQIQGAERAFFKSFGDPRVVSRSTGRVYPDLGALRADQPDDGPATELLHFAIHSPRSPYGVPRWVGTMLSVLGSRQMEEVNYLYFENKSVPPLALLVSGGRLSDASVPRIERFIEENLKGRPTSTRSSSSRPTAPAPVTAGVRRSNSAHSPTPSSRTPSSRCTTRGTSTRWAAPSACPASSAERAKTSTGPRPRAPCGSPRTRSSSPSATSSTS